MKPLVISSSTLSREWITFYAINRKIESMWKELWLPIYDQAEKQNILAPFSMETIHY